MQKKLIALAIAGMIAAPAFAQSNVTVYGIIDTFVGYGKAGDDKFTGVGTGVLSGSRLGFKGSEDLGNGLKAVFTLEQGFKSDTGASDSDKEFHRQAWVGLQGGFGFVGLGRQYAPGYNATAAVDAVSAGAVDPQAILTGAKFDDFGFSIVPGTAARWDNSVKYVSPNMSGFTAEVIYAFGGDENGKDRSDDNRFGLGLNYASGPLGVYYAYHKVKSAETLLIDKAETTEHYLGATYDFGVVKLVGSYQKADVDVDGAADELKADVWYIGGIVPVGAGNVHIAYGKLGVDDFDGMNLEADAKSFSVAYTHALSKRTTAYAGVNRTTNDDNSALGALAKEDGKGSTSFAVGIRHAF